MLTGEMKRILDASRDIGWVMEPRRNKYSPLQGWMFHGLVGKG